MNPNEQQIIGGTWLLTITGWAVEHQPTLNALSTAGAILLTCFGVVNYIIKWRKGKF